MPRRDDDEFDDDRPRRRSEDDDDFDRPRRKSGGGGTTVVLIIVAVAMIGLCVVGGVGYGVWAAISKVREAAARMQSMNNLKQIALAMHMYEDNHSHLPMPSMTGPGDRNGLSWRAAVLPYLEQDAIFRSLRTDQPWDSPANRQFTSAPLRVFSSAGDPATQPEAGRTRFRVFVGGGAMFEWDKKTRVGGKEDERTAVITDGTSNTIMIVEAADPVPWAKPEELEYDPRGPLPRLGPPDRDVVLLSMADGAVKPMKKSTPEATLRPLITRNGGEVVSADF
jgi:hypothetical protein